MKGITNANNVANSEVNAKQPLLVSGKNIKTVNGNSLLGAGNLATDTYQPFPAGWRTSGTIDQLMADITADNSAVVGMAYLGEVTCSDLPFNGNAELIVNIMNGSGSSKVIWAELTSGDISPYFWHYTYWNSHGSGWRSYIPTDLSSGTLVTGIGYDASGNLVKGAIPQPTGFTNQEMEDICDDILWPALPAPTNVSASGTILSFDEVQGAESYEVFADGTSIGEYIPGGNI